MINYRILEKPSDYLDFLQIQNVRQYHFHNVAKYEKISPKESINKALLERFHSDGNTMGFYTQTQNMQ